MYQASFFNFADADYRYMLLELGSEVKWINCFTAL